MTESDPFDGVGDMEPTRVPLTGPNVISTFDSPPHPDAVRAHDAAIRKHLQDRHDRRAQQDQQPPQDS